MPGPGWLASLPLQGAAALERRLRGPLPRLPAPCVSVGNLALGGRGKTPLVAALARHAADMGLRPAVLSRGYGGSVRMSQAPVVVRSETSGPSWLQPVRRRASRVGDEPAWIAAVCPGVSVGVHPRREWAAEAVLARGPVDLFLLDDGFQARVQRDLDLVLVDPSRDPPFARRAALREGSGALARAHLVVTLGDDRRPEHPSLRREPAGLARLEDGAPVDPASLPPLTVAAGVASADSVSALARRAGLEVRRRIPVGDHGQPGPVRRSLLARCQAVLVTEKDAVGWAAARPPSPLTVVLQQRIEGVAALWSRIVDALELRA